MRRIKVAWIFFVPNKSTFYRAAKKGYINLFWVCYKLGWCETKKLQIYDQ